MTTYFTSDSHFGHVNIRTLARRPWPDIETMNVGLAAKWNARVKPEDTVYLLGDFAMGPKILHKGYFDGLNGKKILVRGNHDQSRQKMLDMGWAEVHNSLETVINGLKVFMAHIPTGFDSYVGREYAPEFVIQPPEEFDVWLCGHVHGAWAEVATAKGQRIINVGVDVRNYEPKTFEELLNG